MHQPLIDALALLKKYLHSRARTYPVDEEVPIAGVVRDLWRDVVMETAPQGQPRVNRISYELCVLPALRERLRCKESWVVGADQYRNPDDDVPTDFVVQRVAGKSVRKYTLRRYSFFFKEIEAKSAEFSTLS